MPRKNTSRASSKSRTPNSRAKLATGQASRTGRGKKQLTKLIELIKGIREKFLTRQRVGLLFIIAGCVVFMGLGVYRAVYAQDLSFTVSEAAQTTVPVVVGEELGQLPKRIIIEKAGIDLPVFPGEITKGKWTVDARGANHWRESAKLDEPGNVVIYGHNWKNLLGPIRSLQVGDQIQMAGENDQFYNYTITQTLIVKPTQVEIVLPTKEPQLTLYTCIGFMDRERFVVVAKPKL